MRLEFGILARHNTVSTEKDLTDLTYKIARILHPYGRTQLTEPFKSDIVTLRITALSYKVLLSGKHTPDKEIILWHFGPYRYVEIIQVDWSVMTSLGGEGKYHTPTRKICFLTRS